MAAGSPANSSVIVDKHCEEYIMTERIGLIGLGLMGRPMAHHLLTAGYHLTVFNRSRPAIDELASAGARAAHSPREVAEQSDIVMTMLPDGPDVESVIVGADGLREGVREGMLFIDMSTISPFTTRRIASILEPHGVRALDAPVRGGEEGAKSATLSIIVGGSEEYVQAGRPRVQRRFADGDTGRAIVYLARR